MQSLQRLRDDNCQVLSQERVVKFCLESVLVKKVNLAVDPLPTERVLGVMWCVGNDSFRFRIELVDHHLTRKGALSIIGSIYDPNSYIVPVTTQRKADTPADVQRPVGLG